MKKLETKSQNTMNYNIKVSIILFKHLTVFLINAKLNFVKAPKLVNL